MRCSACNSTLTQDDLDLDDGQMCSDCFTSYKDSLSDSDFFKDLEDFLNNDEV